MTALETAYETTIAELRRATNAALDLAAQLASARQDPDQWTRFPSASGRCAISGFSRSKIGRLAAEGTIRRKTVGSSAFYSAADLRAFLSQP